MQAIETKYLGPTNTKGSRIKAFCEAGSITISRSFNASDWDGHRLAVVALCKKLDAEHAKRYDCEPGKSGWTSDKRWGAWHSRGTIWVSETSNPVYSVDFTSDDGPMPCSTL